MGFICIILILYDVVVLGNIAKNVVVVWWLCGGYSYNLVSVLFYIYIFFFIFMIFIYLFKK